MLFLLHSFSSFSNNNFYSIAMRADFRLFPFIDITFIVWFSFISFSLFVLVDQICLRNVTYIESNRLSCLCRKQLRFTNVYASFLFSTTFYWNQIYCMKNCKQFWKWNVGEHFDTVCWLLFSIWSKSGCHRDRLESSGPLRMCSLMPNA